MATADRVVNIGIDFGSTGLRVAYAVTGQPTRLVTVPGPAISPAVPWLLCELTANGIAFPSLKHRLGVDHRPAVDVPSLVARALGEVRQWVEAETRARTGRAVFSVPARYSSSQREALRDAARAAGFGQVQLIGDSVAAVIAERDRGGADGTYLVFGMGYSGFEVGLVRAVGPHYRVLGYEFGAAPGGSTLDECVIGGWIMGIMPMRPDLSRLEAADWLRVRAGAEQVKQQLDGHDTAWFPISLVRPDGRDGITVRFEGAQFADVVRAYAEGTVGRVRELLERCRLGMSDVDVLLLAGGSTRLTKVRSALEGGLGAKAAVATADHLARGALLFIDRAAGSAGHEEAAAEPVGDAPRPSAKPPALVGTAMSPPAQPAAGGGAGFEPLTLPEARTPGDEGSPGSELSRARWLADHGRRAEAVALLRDVVQQAQAMLAELDDGDPAGPPDDQDTVQARSRRVIVEARAMLAQGQLERAVKLSHAAWGAAFDNADAFEAMIEIHCLAAAAKNTIEGYTDAVRWLRCAYSHDQSNAQVRNLLAERAFEHARQLQRLGRRAEALQAVNECLTWDPEHRAASSLLQRLDRSGPAHQPNP